MMHVLLSLVAYLLGSIPFGLIVSKLWAEIDIRQHGSGNIGMTNVMRTVGYLPGLVTLLLDVAKGYVPVLLARQVSGDPTTALIIGVFAIAGHNWSVFLRFKGGKGVATTAGVFLGVAPGIALALFVIFLGVVVLTRYVSLGSILAAVSLPILLIFYRFPWPIVLLGVLISVFTIVRHRANISRLLAGTEYRFGDKAR
ncbi:MAG: glycerol-3-phosphate 1-O-acyltransferase PlsY [Firmicutes bacterium]|jgi:glycerol-3-phosphate acyltransferase PlsY|nr:glycerol-3-phosphate 1-O-acyltransferase PlsY [Bacillota bacterium]